MKNLVLVMLLLGSFSAFSMGEDKHSTNDGVMCQSELTKSTVEATVDTPAENTAKQEG